MLFRSVATTVAYRPVPPASRDKRRKRQRLGATGSRTRDLTSRARGAEPLGLGSFGDRKRVSGDLRLDCALTEFYSVRGLTDGGGDNCKWRRTPAIPRVRECAGVLEWWRNRGEKRGEEGRLTPSCQRRGSDGQAARTVAKGGVVELGGAAPAILGARRGSVEVVGSKEVPFPRFPGFGDGRSSSVGGLQAPAMVSSGSVQNREEFVGNGGEREVAAAGEMGLGLVFGSASGRYGGGSHVLPG